MSLKTIKTMFGKSTYFRFHCELVFCFFVFFCYNVYIQDFLNQHNTTTQPLVASSGHPVIAVVGYIQITVLVHVWSDYRIKRSGWMNIKRWEDCEVSTSVWIRYQESRRVQTLPRIINVFESVIDQLFSFKLTDGDLVLSSWSKLKTMFDCQKNTWNCCFPTWTFLTFSDLLRPHPTKVILCFCLCFQVGWRPLG